MARTRADQSRVRARLVGSGATLRLYFPLEGRASLMVAGEEGLGR